MTATRTAQRRSTVRRSLVGAVATAGLVGTLASTAVAAPPPGSETDPTGKPNLAFSALSASWTGSAWRLVFTVVNKGDAYARSSTMSISGSSSSVPGIEAGSSWTSSRLLGDTYGCAFEFNATLDTGRVVPELSEYDNTRRATGIKTGCPPRFRVVADGFYVIDESGVDWSGSDEPYWTLHASTGRGQRSGRLSHTFGDVDTGEGHMFPADQRCLLGCDTSVGVEIGAGLGLSAQLWEMDAMENSEVLRDMAAGIGSWMGDAVELDYERTWSGYGEKVKPYVTDAVHYVLDWAANDNLGYGDWGYTGSQLAASLPPGRSGHFSHVVSDGDASYQIHFLVTRIL